MQTPKFQIFAPAKSRPGRPPPPFPPPLPLQDNFLLLTKIEYTNFSQIAYKRELINKIYGIQEFIEYSDKHFQYTNKSIWRIGIIKSCNLAKVKKFVRNFLTYAKIHTNTQAQANATDHITRSAEVEDTQYSEAHSACARWYKTAG